MTKLDEVCTTIANLELGYDHIRENVPADLIKMRYYRSTDQGEIVPYLSPESCGTCGCLLGHMANSEVLPALPSFYVEVNGILQLDFDEYGYHYFPALAEDFQCEGERLWLGWREWDAVFSAELAHFNKDELLDGMVGCIERLEELKTYLEELL